MEVQHLLLQWLVVHVEVHHLPEEQFEVAAQRLAVPELHLHETVERYRVSHNVPPVGHHPVREQVGQGTPRPVPPSTLLHRGAPSVRLGPSWTERRSVTPVDPSRPVREGSRV